MKYPLAIVSAAFLTLGLAGCGGDESGTALPGETSSAPTSEAPGSEPIPSSSSNSNSADPASTSLDPCSIISSSDLATVGKFDGVEPKKEEKGGARTCTWVAPGVGGDSVGVGIRDTQNVGDLNDAGSGIERDEVNGRQVAKTASPQGLCYVAVEISDASRVDIQGIKDPGSRDVDASCELATKVAQLDRKSVV